MRDLVLRRCQEALPGWRGLTVDDVDFDEPKGFSSFTMGVRPRPVVDPPAVLYRQLAGKDNAILDFAAERDLFLFLGAHHIAARCLGYQPTHRIEEFYVGRTLTAADVLDPDIQRKVAGELSRLHRLRPAGLPSAPYFELLADRWAPLVARVLAEGRAELPPDEQALCDELGALLSDDVRQMVRRCQPDRTPVFCHNDTYHGNVFLLGDGTVRLLDFEFSCLNHASFDIANFFAETTLEHGLADRPHFRLIERPFTDDDLARFVGFYLDHATFESPTARRAEHEALLAETRRAVMLSDYMYAMAAIPLALEPIKRIRFIPYAHQRFRRFRAAWHAELGGTA